MRCMFQANLLCFMFKENLLRYIFQANLLHFVASYSVHRPLIPDFPIFISSPPHQG